MGIHLGGRNLQLLTRENGEMSVGKKLILVFPERDTHISRNPFCLELTWIYERETGQPARSDEEMAIAKLAAHVREIYS